MAGVNKVILLGNLGADPEVRNLENGATVCNIRLATSETYKDRNGERQTNTEWHDVEMWEGLARVAEQYLKKGDMVYVEGKIKSDTWQDEQGNNRKKMRIRAISMNMIRTGGESGGGMQPGGGSQKSNPPQQQAPSQTASASGAADSNNDVDDLPF